MYPHTCNINGQQVKDNHKCRIVCKLSNIGNIWCFYILFLSFNRRTLPLILFIFILLYFTLYTKYFMQSCHDLFSYNSTGVILFSCIRAIFASVLASNYFVYTKRQLLVMFEDMEYSISFFRANGGNVSTITSVIYFVSF